MPPNVIQAKLQDSSVEFTITDSFRNTRENKQEAENLIKSDYQNSDKCCTVVHELKSDMTRSNGSSVLWLFRTASSESHISNTSAPVRPVDDRWPSARASPRPPPTTSRPTPSRLLESGIVLRLEDFALYRVSSAIDERRNTPRKFVSSDKKQLLLPKSMSSVHLEFTDYYFPDGKDLPGEFCLRIFFRLFIVPFFCCLM